MLQHTTTALPCILFSYGLTEAAAARSPSEYLTKNPTHEPSQYSVARFHFRNLQSPLISRIRYSISCKGEEAQSPMPL